MNSDKTADFLQSHALVAYYIHVVWLSLNEKSRKHVTTHGNIPLVFFSVGSEEIEIEGSDAVRERGLYRYGHSSSEVVLLEKAISHKSLSTS